ncbi:MAG: fructose bisphosphate aldolase [Longimicrobiales bacterium]
MIVNQEMMQKIRAGDGFIAALDQSGGSTPKALKSYGVGEDAYSNETEMYDRIHEMRTRIITTRAFDQRVIGAILFENTMDRDVEGRGTAEFLWTQKQIVPFLKIDKGLAAEDNGVQMMKPIGGLEELLNRAVGKGVFGTKERSVVNRANRAGIQAIVDQQFEIGLQVLRAGLVPILEPEVDIKAPDKREAEAMLRDAIVAGLDKVPQDAQVMLKLTLPEEAGFYTPLVNHPRVLKVVALSGGYTRDDANEKLARNPGVIASFSRALSEGLSAGQGADDFDSTLDESIGSIHAASIA